ncbi:MAG: HD domain-containing phosphohydrolase [Elusimicrobiota bacterium]
MSANNLKKLLLESKKLRLLITFNERVRLASGIDETLGVLFEEIKEVLNAERATLFLLDSRKEELYARIATGLDANMTRTLRFSAKRGIAGSAVSSGRSVNVANAYKDKCFDPRFDELYHFKTVSVLATPLFDTHNKVIGVLEIFNKRKEKRFSKEDEGLANLIANQLSAALENSQLLEQLKRSNLESIYILAQAAEYRDQEDTATHLKRISDYATMLAKTIGLPSEQVENIRFASPLHDIGKIAIPDTILRKPGRYTPEEYEEMKKHTTLGYEILKDAQSPMLTLAREIALTHHERFDGTGYPRQLQGKEIPISSRIVSLADVFDALSTERVYKPPWPFEKVVEFIDSQSGKQFDPEVVEAFRTCLPKIEPLVKF